MIFALHLTGKASELSDDEFNCAFQYALYEK
jgi:hypothetical protein